jgi:hypothetical protein
LNNTHNFSFESIDEGASSNFPTEFGKDEFSNNNLILGLINKKMSTLLFKEEGFNRRATAFMVSM